MTTKGPSDARTKQARIMGSILILCLGLVPLVVNWPYLFDPGSANREAGWLATACGAVGIGVGIWLLAGMRFRGRAPVLTGQRWRYLCAAVALGGCLTVLFLILSASELHMTGFPAWWVTMILPLLFVPAGSAQQATAPLTPAQYRTWWRILGGCLAVGLILCVAAGFGVVSGNGLLAGLLLHFGLVFLVFPVTFWAVFLRHQREALHDSSQ